MDIIFYYFAPITIQMGSTLVATGNASESEQQHRSHEYHHENNEMRRLCIHYLLMRTINCSFNVLENRSHTKASKDSER